MKLNFLTGLAIIAVIFAGCKNEKSVDSLEVVTPQIVNKSFTVTLTVLVKQDDDFSLYFTEDGSINFIEPIWMGVKGSNEPQKVVFTLPEEVFPTQLRLDFGMNKNQPDIILQSVGFDYKGNQRIISGTELGNFFRPDDSKCSFNPGTGVISAVVKEGVRQYPSLYPHEANLQPELEKLAK